MSRLRLASVLVTAVALGGLLTACSSTVALDPAPDANDPLCAVISVRLPDTLGGQERRWTDAQATGAWGTPSAVILTCGVTPPGPSTLPCSSVNGVDWIVDDTDAPYYRVTSFGRTPAVEVYLNSEIVSSADVLDTVSGPVGLLPVDAICTDRPTT